MREIPLEPTAADIITKMRNISALAPLGDKLLTEVVELSKLRTYAKGEVIIEEGAQDSWLYFLVLGELMVEHQGVAVHNLKTFGEMFGEMGLIDGSPRSATVKAVGPSVCLALDASLFGKLDPADRAALKLAFNEIILVNMAARLREMDKKLAERDQKPA